MALHQKKADIPPIGFMCEIMLGRYFFSGNAEYVREMIGYYDQLLVNVTPQDSQAFFQYVAQSIIPLLRESSEVVEMTLEEIHDTKLSGDIRQMMKVCVDSLHENKQLATDLKEVNAARSKGKTF